MKYRKSKATKLEALSCSETTRRGLYFPAGDRRPATVASARVGVPGLRATLQMRIMVGEGEARGAQRPVPRLGKSRSAKEQCISGEDRGCSDPAGLVMEGTGGPPGLGPGPCGASSQHVLPVGVTSSTLRASLSLSRALPALLPSWLATLGLAGRGCPPYPHPGAGVGWGGGCAHQACSPRPPPGPAPRTQPATVHWDCGQEPTSLNLLIETPLGRATAAQRAEFSPAVWET